MTSYINLARASHFVDKIAKWPSGLVFRLERDAAYV